MAPFALKIHRYAFLASGGAASGMNELSYNLTEQLSTIDGAEVICFEHGWLGLMNKQYRTIQSSDINSFRKAGGAFMGSCSNVNVFNYKGEDRSLSCLNTYRDLNLECIVVFGGDGSMRQANELSSLGINFICIPATMDMDIIGTSQTVGFYTAFHEAARSIVAMARDGKAMGRHVMIECMGRKSGYPTLYAAYEAMRQTDVKIDIVLLPGFSFSEKKLTEFIKNADHPLTIVASEGIETLEMFINNSDDFEEVAGLHKHLAGSAISLMQRITSATDVTIKTTQVGYTQRSANTVDSDCQLALKFISKAIECLAKEIYNVAIVSYPNNDEYGYYSLKKITGMNPRSDAPKLIPPNDLIYKVMQNRIFIEGNN